MPGNTTLTCHDTMTKAVKPCRRCRLIPFVPMEGLSEMRRKGAIIEPVAEEGVSHIGL